MGLPLPAFGDGTKTLLWSHLLPPTLADGVGDGLVDARQLLGQPIGPMPLAIKLEVSYFLVY